MKKELINYLTANYPENDLIDLLATDLLAAHQNLRVMELLCERLKVERNYYKNLAAHHARGGYNRNSHRGPVSRPIEPPPVDPVTDDWIQTGRELVNDSQ